MGAFELDDVKEEDGVNVKERVNNRSAWRYLNIPDQIVDVGMCLQEYDLIGVICIRHKLSSPTNNCCHGPLSLTTLSWVLFSEQTKRFF